MCLDAVLKPVTRFEVNTGGLDTQLFKKITHACTHLNQLFDTYQKLILIFVHILSF